MTIPARIIRSLCAAASGLYLLGVLGDPNASVAAQITAAVEYEFIPRPAGLANDFRPDEGASLRFLTIKTIDGYHMGAALWQPNRKQPADTTLVGMAPGDNNYQTPPQSTLGHGLADKGYAALAIDTRNHDGNIYGQNFLDLRRDVEAAVQTARALGYRSLVLQGHSQGSLHVQFYAATTWEADIKAVILLGAFADLPWKTRNVLVQDEENYKALVETSTKALRDGTLAAELPVRMHSFTGQHVPITAQHFLTYRWDTGSIASGTFWIQRIPRPILLVRDQADAYILPFEPYALLSAAHREGSVVPSIKYIMLPDAKPPTPQGHYFVGNERPLIDAVASWLAEQHL